MKMRLFDRNLEVCAALEEAFAGVPEVDILLVEDIDELPLCDALVAPGNSFGVMTGGLDLALREALGQAIQDDLQHLILSHGVPLPVGQALSLALKEPKIARHILYAPTMYTPQQAQFLDVSYAMQAAIYLALILDFADVAVPGLGTGAGEMKPVFAATAMRAGYDAALAMATFLKEYTEEDQ